LLNAVFRGFHTIKGGASFIALTALLDVFHVSADTFNLLRQGERSVDAHLLDVMLRVVDVLNVMFDEVRAGEQPTAAEPALIDDLKGLLVSGDPAPAAATPAPAPAATPVAEPAATQVSAEPASDDITDQEFEQLLDALDEKPAAAAAAPVAAAADSDAITEDEFDSLLDELHGDGAPGVDTKSPEPAPTAASTNKEDISEEDFDEIGTATRSE